LNVLAHDPQQTALAIVINSATVKFGGVNIIAPFGQLASPRTAGESIYLLFVYAEAAR
jgi:hypothetical protein